MNEMNTIACAFAVMVNGELQVNAVGAREGSACHCSVSQSDKRVSVQWQQVGKIYISAMGASGKSVHSCCAGREVGKCQCNGSKWGKGASVLWWPVVASGKVCIHALQLVRKCASLQGSPVGEVHILVQWRPVGGVHVNVVAASG